MVSVELFNKFVKEADASYMEVSSNNSLNNYLVYRKGSKLVLPISTGVDNRWADYTQNLITQEELGDESRVNYVEWFIAASNFFDYRWSKLLNRDAFTTENYAYSMKLSDIHAYMDSILPELPIKIISESERYIKYELSGNIFKIDDGYLYEGDIFFNEQLIPINLGGGSAEQVCGALFPVDIIRELKLKELTEDK
jgi:hypothetical protein